jgi:hypothetical protein
MSVDLTLDGVRPIRVTPLLPKISAVLIDLLDLTTSPTLTLARLEQGELVPVITDQMGTDGSPLLFISIAGEEETVQLVGCSDSLTVSIGGPRSNLQYALGAAVAITLAREFTGVVWDDRKFFGDQVRTTPEALLEQLRVAGPNDDYHEAASRIRWGPAGGPGPRDSQVH